MPGLHPRLPAFLRRSPGSASVAPAEPARTTRRVTGVAELEEGAVIVSQPSELGAALLVQAAELAADQGIRPIHLVGEQRFQVSGRAHLRAHDRVTLTASGDVDVVAYHEATVWAFEDCTVMARNGATVWAFDNVQVEAYDGSEVHAFHSVQVSAYGGARVAANDQTHVSAEGNHVQITASQEVSVYAPEAVLRRRTVDPLSFPEGGLGVDPEPLSL